ncbi:hypothetical protein [Hyphomicrobium sp. CS1GBMeth3]|uniref:hypothetical protein n=1 Tax=Hyphomicrobium sp. CS1GBMeth3 TaxID=1892845 RepID=UPI0009315EE6|nr:hypothetical protein [Hyphomicrobium sp. CS1GBMeth3]
MTASPNTLEPGDIIEIKYRVWRAAESGETLVERWIAATVTDCEDGSWPLARLADGQVTEIRPFMPWRTVMKARRAIAA